MRPADLGDTLDRPKHTNEYVNSIITKTTLHAIAPPRHRISTQIPGW